MPRFRKKPIIVEAFKWTGDIEQTEDPKWCIKAIENNNIHFVFEGTPGVKMVIKTPEGNRTANRGDYIVKGINGEIYPRKPDIFEQTYDPIDGLFTPECEKELRKNGITYQQKGSTLEFNKAHKIPLCWKMSL